MLENTGILVAGLSGGADSVCLVAVLKEIIEKEQLDIRLLAVHVNHGIRGTEAERDEQFAKQLCRQLSVEYISRRVDVPSVAHQEKLSEEEAGRILRYRIFKEIATQQEKHTGRKVKIAVAHHQNDQAETVLMNLVRGSSLRGICGIRPVRDNIIRPLLCVSRAQIEEYLTLQGLSYVTDSTNEELVYTRNKIRRELIPYLEKNLNPNAVQKLTELADSVLQAEEYIEQQAAGLYEKAVILQPQENPSKPSVKLSVKALVSAPPVLQQYAIRQAIEAAANGAKDIYRVHVGAVQELLEHSVGKCVSLPYGLVAVRGYDEITIARNKTAHLDSRKQCGGIHGGTEQCGSLPQNAADSAVQMPDLRELEKIWRGKRITIPVNEPVYFTRVNECRKAVVILEQGSLSEIYGNNDYTKLFDYDKIEDNFSFRFRKTADFIRIDRNGTKKTLKKELIDKKVPRQVRDAVLLLAVSDEILWAAGVRRSSAGLVTDSTQRILKISVVMQEDK